MGDKTTKMGYAFHLLQEAKNAMIEAIESAVSESDTNEVSYDETIDESCGYTEERIIGKENGRLCVFDEYGNKIQYVDNFSADELFNICNKIS
jgi:hypothetical protein